LGDVELLLYEYPLPKRSHCLSPDSDASANKQLEPAMGTVGSRATTVQFEEIKRVLARMGVTDRVGAALISHSGMMGTDRSG